MITVEKARELLDAYGSKATHWPDEHREQLQAFINDNVDAQGWLREARALDELLDSSRVPMPDLTAQIMQALPVSRIDRLLAWLRPQSFADCWRPSVAAACPLIIGLAIGLNELPGDLADPSLAAAWDATEAALLEPVSLGIWYE